MNLRQAVVFAVLMEGNGGILSKHPDYVMEKLRLASSLKEPEVLLDHNNLRKFKKYLEIWKVED